MSILGEPDERHQLSSRELEDLDLLRLGALGATSGYGAPGNGPTLVLPGAGRAPAVLGLVDPEGVLLSVVDVARTYPRPAGTGVVGAVRHLADPGSRPFARLYTGPHALRARLSGAPLTVLVDRPLSDRDLEDVQAAREGRPVVLLTFTGSGSVVGQTPTGLLRATVRAAELLGDALVAAIPLGRHEDPVVRADLRRRVLAAYAPDGVLVIGGEGPLPAHVAAAVRADREAWRGRGTVVLFTGLSGSGKSTLARALHDLVLEDGRRTVTLLDGDVVRRNLSAGLSFSVADRETNIRRIGWVAAEIARHRGLAICSPIAPFDRTRRQVRTMVEDAGGELVLVHVATPLAECERRDRKGLYAQARRGEIPDFTGISSPYERPEDADLVIDTTSRPVADALREITDHLRGRGALPASAA